MVFGSPRFAFGGYTANMNKSESLKHVPVSSIEEVVDEAMAYLPSNFDITKPENKVAVRKWMVRVCEVVVKQAADSMGKAAESAIQEAAALAINPDYYAEKKRGRERRKAHRAIMQNREKPKSRAEVAFERLSGESNVKM